MWWRVLIWMSFRDCSWDCVLQHEKGRLNRYLHGFSSNCLRVFSLGIDNDLYTCHVSPAR